MPGRGSSARALSVIAGLTLAFAVAGAIVGGGAVWAQDGDASTTDAEPAHPPVIHPIPGRLSLLDNTGPAASPAALLAPLDGMVAAAVTYDAIRGRCDSYRPGG